MVYNPKIKLPRKPDEMVRILMLGDELTQGIGSTDSMSYPQ